jgi:hypothetical protein
VTFTVTNKGTKITEFYRYFRVTGDAKPLSADAKLAEATASYQRYVRSQTGSSFRCSRSWPATTS